MKGIIAGLITIIVLLGFVGECQIQVNQNPLSNFGVFPFGLSSTQQIGVVNSLDVRYIRNNLIVHNFTGTVPNYTTYRNANLGIIQSIDWLSNNGGTTPQPFVSNLTGYGDTLENIFIAAPNIDVAVCENEETNKQYHSGWMFQYLNQLNTFISKAHSATNHPRIKVADGGIHPQGVCYWVWKWLQTVDNTTATQWQNLTFSPAMKSAANNPGSNPQFDLYWRQIDSLLNGFTTNSMDYVNLHFYEPINDVASGVVATRYCIATMAYYIKLRTGKEVITNECGQTNSNTTLVPSMLQAMAAGDFKYGIWFSGDGTNAVALNNTDGTLRSNGISYKKWIDLYNPQKTLGKKYYFSTLSGDDNRTSTQAQNPSTPWRTLSKLNSFFSSLQAGDSVFFKKGETYIGNFIITKSGNSGTPIVITSYGTGNKPKFQYNIAGNLSKTIPQRVIVYASAGISYITISDISFTDTTTNSTAIHTATTANVGYAIDFDGSTTVGCNGNLLSNLDISLVGDAIEMHGNNNTVTLCNISDLGGVRNVAGSTTNYGANAVTFGGSNNIITYNTWLRCWRTDLTEGYDGGAIEVFGAVNGRTSNNQVLYNTAIDCEGFGEFGSDVSTDVMDNNVVAYNLMINNGRVFYINNSGQFTTGVSNLQLYNNDIIEAVGQRSNYSFLLSSASTAASGTLVAKNNVFYVSRSVTVLRNTFSSLAYLHSNNIYKMVSGTLGFTLSSSEVSINSSAPLFTSTVGSADTWDFHLLINSQAIDLGTDLGYTHDIEGTPIRDNPDAGCYENELQFAVTLPLNPYLTTDGVSPYPMFNDAVIDPITPTGFKNVMDYGAVGNGSTNDDAAIVAAFNAANNATGVRGVYFPPGHTYMVHQTNTVNLTQDITVWAYNATIKMQPLAAVYSAFIFNHSGVWSGNFLWLGGTIDGNQFNQTYPGNSHGGIYDGGWLAANGNFFEMDNMAFFGVKDVNVINTVVNGFMGVNCKVIMYQDGAASGGAPLFFRTAQGVQGTYFKARGTNQTTGGALYCKNLVCTGGSIAVHYSTPTGNPSPKSVCVMNGVTTSDNVQNNFHFEDCLVILANDCHTSRSDTAYANSFHCSNQTLVSSCRNSTFENTRLDYVNASNLQIAIIDNNTFSNPIGYGIPDFLNGGSATIINANNHYDGVCDLEQCGTIRYNWEDTLVNFGAKGITGNLATDGCRFNNGTKAVSNATGGFVTTNNVFANVANTPTLITPANSAWKNYFKQRLKIADGDGNFLGYIVLNDFSNPN